MFQLCLSSVRLSAIFLADAPVCRLSGVALRRYFFVFVELPRSADLFPFSHKVSNSAINSVRYQIRNTPSVNKYDNYSST